MRRALEHTANAPAATTLCRPASDSQPLPVPSHPPALSPISSFVVVNCCLFFYSFSFSFSLARCQWQRECPHRHGTHTCSSGALLLQQQPQPSASTDERLRITQRQHRPLLQDSLKSDCSYLTISLHCHIRVILSE